MHKLPSKTTRSLAVTRKRTLTTRIQKSPKKTKSSRLKSSTPLTTSKRTWLSGNMPQVPYTGPKKVPELLMELYEVTPQRTVPDHIKKPPYAAGNNSGSPSVSPFSRPEIKTDQEVAQMRQVCEMASYIRQFAGKQVRVGITTDEIDQIVHDEIIRLGAYPSPLNYHGFPKSLCTSINSVICHGIPDKRPLEDGDLINLDITLYYDDYHGDCSGMFVAGKVDETTTRLIDATKLAMMNGISICHPGQHFRQIGLEVQRVADEYGYGINTMFAGHGIGKDFHQAPEIMHCRNNIPGIMQKNMTFTVEPILNESLWTDVVHHRDGWTVMTPDGARSAQCEETIVITDDGFDIMTKHKPGYFDKQM